MVEKPGNKWQKLPAVAEAFSKLLLPLVIAGVGIVFSYIQHRSDVEQRKADRVTSFIKHLASDNIEEKELALRVMNVLIDQGQLPSELGPALISSAANSNTTISQLSQGALTKLARKDSSLEKSFVQAVQQNPDLAVKVQARVFLHASTVLQMKLSKNIATHLKRNGFAFLEIERVKASPDSTQLRYYRQNEKNEVDKIIKQLLDFGLKQVKARYFKGYENSVRPRTYELWLGSTRKEIKNHKDIIGNHK